MGRHQRRRLSPKHLRVQLDPNEVYGLLCRLCIRFGFCLPPEEIERLCLNPPAGVEEFTEVVLSAEGYSYTRSDELCRAARDEVERSFVEHLEKRRY